MAEEMMIPPQLPPQIRWMAPEFRYHEKESTWNSGVVIVAILLIAFALWQRNFLFAVFIVIATALLIYWGHRKPESIEFLFDEKGLMVRGNRSDYKDMDGFTVRINEQEDNKWNELVLRVKSRFTQHMFIFIPKSETEQIRNFLSKYISEIEHEDSFVDVLADFLKF